MALHTVLSIVLLFIRIITVQCDQEGNHTIDLDLLASIRAVAEDIVVPAPEPGAVNTTKSVLSTVLTDPSHSTTKTTRSTSATTTSTSTTTTRTTPIPDPCVGVLCENGGWCKDGICSCQPGFKGSLCHIAICSEAYLRSPTNGQKSCSSQPEMFSDITCDLTCDPGFYFDDGQLTHVYDCTDGMWLPSERDVANCHRVDYCLNVTCLHNGTCREGWREGTCDCLPGYQGPTCQIDIDECLSSPCQHGGTCTSGPNTFSCTCPAGHGGVRCETEIIDVPELTSVSPGYGPWAGGTLITVTGKNFIVPTRYVYMYLSDLLFTGEQRPKVLCKVLKSNQTQIVARTPPASEEVEKFLPLGVEFAGGSVYSSRLYFQYRPNPHISAIQPTHTIVAGGTSLTLLGTALNSVSAPVIQVSLVATWKTAIGDGQVVTNKDKTVFAKECHVGSGQDGSELVCEVPKLELTDTSIPRPYTHRTRRSISSLLLGSTHADELKASQRQPENEHRIRNKLQMRNQKRNQRARREQSQSQAQNMNTTEWKYFLGVQMDGYDRYTNISAVTDLGDYGLLTVHPGPHIPPRPNPVKYDDLNDGPLVINGSELLLGLEAADYRVTVGKEVCIMIDITDSIVKCQPPESQPDNHDETVKDPIIMVYVGSNIAIEYGSLQYPSSIWIIVGPILGVLVVLIAILVALFLLRKRMRKVQKLRKKKYHYSPGEMIRLPNLKNEEREEALKIPNHEGGSLLVFQNEKDNTSELYSDRDKQSPSHYGGSSMVDSEDEFDPPEEFYENKETIKRQQSHHEALQNFMGNTKPNTPRYTAEPQEGSNVTRKGSKSKKGSYPSLKSFDTKNSQPDNEDIYMNNEVDANSVNTLDTVDQDIYENTNPSKKSAKKKNKPFKPREPAKLPHRPRVNEPLPDIPPPVPDTPRPKLNITPQYRNNSPSTLPHRSTNGGNRRQTTTDHPFEENAYTNTRRDSDEDHDDIYVNSPIKARGLRASGRGKRGRGAARGRAQRSSVERSNTMWK